MHPIIKYSLYGFGGVVLLGGGALGYIAATFDPNALKPQIEALVLKEKQRTLSLQGPIKLSLLPTLGATLSDVGLSEKGSTAPFAHIGSARVSLQFWPLLGKRVVVDAVELHGAEVKLVRDAQGQFNFADLLSKDENPEPNPPVDFDVSRLRVDGIQVDFDDRQGGRHVQLNDLALAADGISKKGLRNLELKGRARLDQPALDLQLGLKLDKLDMDSEAGRFALADLEAQLAGKLAADTVQLKLGAPKLDIAGQSASAAELTLDALLEGAGRRLASQIRLDTLKASPEGMEAKALTVNIDAKQGATVAKLALRSPLVWQTEAQALSLPQLTLKGEVTAGPAKAAPVDLSGHFQLGLKAEQLASALSGQLDGSSLTLKSELKGFAQPAMRVELKADTVDLDRYIVPAKPAAASSGGAPAKVDLSPLAPLDLDARLSLGQLKQGSLDARDLRLVLAARDGLIRVPTASLKAFGGAIALSGSATATASPQIKLQPQLSNVDINAVLKQFANFDRLEGRGAVSGDLALQGADVNALKHSVSGHLQARITDGALRGINIGKTLRDAKSTLASWSGGEKTVASSASERTDFTELTASLQLDKGLISNQDLSMKSPLIRVSGAGQADLKTETVDYLIKAALVATSKGQSGAERDNLRGLTIPVRVKGSFNAPSYSLDFSSALKDNAGVKLDEKKQEVKQEIKQKADEAIKKGLKGLFK